MSTNLAAMECKYCVGGIPPMSEPQLSEWMNKLGGGWKLVEQHHLEKIYPFKDFRQALAFTNRVGVLAESVGHHPDFHLAWGKVQLTVWTHKIGGLSDADFIFAAKCDKLYS